MHPKARDLRARVALALAVAAASVTAILFAPMALSAQRWSLNLDVALASRYEWRGLIQDPGSNLQHAIYASAEGNGAIATAGLWSVTDLSREARGLPERWGSEISPWVEVSYGSEAVSTFVGATAYRSRSGGPSPALRPRSAWEAYGGAEGMLPHFPIRAEATLYWDLDRVRGGYLESAAALQIPLWTGLIVPIGSLFLEARTGTSLGQERPADDPDAAFYFEERGISHLDVSLRTTSTRVSFHGIEGALTLESRWSRGFDPATKRVGGETASVDPSRWTWIAGVHLSAPSCRPERELCRDL